MINLDIHNVVNVSIEEIRTHSNFSTREIVITDVSGNTSRLTVFSHDKGDEDIKVDVNGTVNLKL